LTLLYEEPAFENSARNVRGRLLCHCIQRCREIAVVSGKKMSAVDADQHPAAVSKCAAYIRIVIFAVPSHHITLNRGGAVNSKNRRRCSAGRHRADHRIRLEPYLYYLGWRDVCGWWVCLLRQSNIQLLDCGDRGRCRKCLFMFPADSANKWPG